MNIQQIRNATLLLEYGGSRFLIDPMLAEQARYPGLAGTVNSHLPYPTVPLPVPLSALLAVDAVILTHTHPDHWDEVAQASIPKALPVYVQHEADKRLLRQQGFSNIRLLRGAVFQGVTLHQTSGQHGDEAALGAIGDILGEVCGVVFQHPAEPTLYLAGDTIWHPDVANSLSQHRPKVVILNCGDAQVSGLGRIIMDQNDVWQVHQAAPEAILIGSHMEAVNHAMLSRSDLRAFALEKGFSDQLLIPADGEVCAL